MPQLQQPWLLVVVHTYLYIHHSEYIFAVYNGKLTHSHS